MNRRPDAGPHIVRPLAGFYGDDFTGASDNLAQFRRHGLRARLFLDAAAIDEQSVRDAGLDVVGFAGIARSLAPQPMADELRPAFGLLARLRPRLIQYKLCSTFDSSPTAGNFAVALGEAARHWPGCAVPVLAAVPEFGRYTAFGHHFARQGDQVYRLDRHPSMSRHAVTPMHEAELARHLAALGVERVALLDLVALAAGLPACEALLDRIGGDPVVFDALSHEDLRRGCELIWRRAMRGPVFALAAQGFAHGLGEHLAAQGYATCPPPAAAIAGVDRLLVLAGSASPATALQIARAEAEGFASLRVDPSSLGGADDGDRAAAILAAPVREALAAGRSVVVYTARGPADPSIAAARIATGRDQAGLARSIGHLFARLMERLRAEGGLLRRLVLAGGDTSSHALRASGAHALDVLGSDLRRNLHLFRIVGGPPALEGLEVLLKGGQVGDDAFFVQALRGS
ncbi:MAG TPA: four-carbon acid sugar kinase family protein [Burkholderiaceae bacterium]|nr:four-carbon acid sugar kinase family protein [Burkholderiaceae bacterium]